jgi:hypothetical protein
MKRPFREGMAVLLGAGRLERCRAYLKEAMALASSSLMSKTVYSLVN